MAIRFHLTPEGPKPCHATKRSCKYGEAAHAATFQEAEALYTASQEGGLLPPPTAKRRPTYSLTPATKEVLARLRALGARPLLVGGCVRDHLLGGESKDVDIEVYGSHSDGNGFTFPELRNAFPRREGFRAEEAGASFSVLKLTYRGEDFDVALPRTEQQVGDHHRSFATEHDSTMSFEEASSRRDFTLNAIGYDPTTGEFVDPHGGREDLQAGVLRHVSEAFQEDPLRCLRAANFASRFGFTMAPETLSYCQKLAPKYSTLAHERVEEELNKVFFKGKSCGQGLALLHEMGWSQRMGPLAGATREELQAWGDKLDEVSPGVLRKASLAEIMEASGHPDPTNYLESSTSVRQEMRALRGILRGSRKKSQGELVLAHRTLKKRWREFSNDDLARWTATMGGDAARVRALPEEPLPPVVTGDSLIALGMTPGRELGTVVKKAQAIQDEEGPLPFEELLARARS